MIADHQAWSNPNPAEDKEPNIITMKMVQVRLDFLDWCIETTDYAQPLLAVYHISCPRKFSTAFVQYLPPPMADKYGVGLWGSNI